jgi:hypothetical protein
VSVFCLFVAARQDPGNSLAFYGFVVLSAVGTFLVTLVGTAFGLAALRTAPRDRRAVLALTLNVVIFLGVIVLWLAQFLFVT